MNATPSAPQAWLVIGQDGNRAVFLEQPPAEAYAVRCHGTVRPLFEGGDTMQAAPPAAPALNLKVLSFRADCGGALDGRTDDRNALANAITRDGAVLEIEGGTLLCDGPLPVPTCAEIRGWGPLATRIVFGPGLTAGTTGMPVTGATRVRDLQLDGAACAGNGIAFGEGGTWFGRSEGVRVQGFAATGAFGMRLADALKGLVLHPYLDGNWHNFVSERATPAFPTSTHVLHMVSVNARGLGALVVDADGIVIDSPVWDSNALGAVHLLPRPRGTIDALAILSPRFEDNAAAQQPTDVQGLGPACFQFVAGDGTGLDVATIRFTMRDPFFAPGAAGALSILLNGPAVADCAITRPNVPAGGVQIVQINGAYGDLSTGWAGGHLPYAAAVFDPLGLDVGPLGRRAAAA